MCPSSLTPAVNRVKACLLLPKHFKKMCVSHLFPFLEAIPRQEFPNYRMEYSLFDPLTWPGFREWRSRRLRVLPQLERHSVRIKKSWKLGVLNFCKYSEIFSVLRMKILYCQELRILTREIYSALILLSRSLSNTTSAWQTMCSVF